MPVSRATPSAYAPALMALAAVFFLRVLAQAVAAFAPVSFVPSMDEWVRPSASAFSTSGLIPYPLLFAAQAAILIVQGLVCRDFLRGRGYFVSLAPRTGRWLVRVSYVYAGAMAARYGVTMALYPERRWLGHTVPIVVHFALAAFLYTLGHYQRGRLASPGTVRHG